MFFTNICEPILRKSYCVLRYIYIKYLRQCLTCVICDIYICIYVGNCDNAALVVDDKAGCLKKFLSIVFLGFGVGFHVRY